MKVIVKEPDECPLHNALVTSHMAGMLINNLRYTFVTVLVAVYIEGSCMLWTLAFC